MAIDMRQFHQTFFEESLEGVEIMESELLHIEEGMSAGNGVDVYREDMEVLHTIFRVVHSIKGGSSTFGFGWVADFSHVLETLLDDLREGRRELTRPAVNLLLQSVDCLRSLLKGARTNSPIDEDMINEVQSTLKEVTQVAHQTDEKKAPSEAPAASTAKSSGGWHIVFRPHSRLFATGNDPLRIINELSTLGKIKVQMDVSALPEWGELEPETSYLGWTLDLASDAPRDVVTEVFDWVADDSHVEITPLITHSKTNQTSAVCEPESPTNQYKGPRTTVESPSTSIRVSTPKVDALVDIVGELIITQTMLNELVNDFTEDRLPHLQSGLTQLERNTIELQQSVMSIRMLPIGFNFNRLPRMVRDVCQRLGKKVDLKINGERTELDKTVIERISDPLMHLVRNCIDHGIEPPQTRIQEGKPETGTIFLEACQKGGGVVVEIADDGQGLQRDKILSKAVERGLVPAGTELSAEQINEMIFLPGFSTADGVSDMSGRGVGMDVVRNNIRSIGGSVKVNSQPGEGTRFTIRLPLTLAIVDGLSVLIGSQTYILPLDSVVESICIKKEQISRPAGGPELLALRKEYLPVIRLYEQFEITPRSTDLTQGILVVVEADGQKAGLYVDDLLGQQQVVIKSLETHYQKVEGVAAATILGNGSVALILDITSLVSLAHTNQMKLKHDKYIAGSNLIEGMQARQSTVDDALRR